MEKLGGVVQSKSGRVIVGAIVRVFLAGTATPAAIYSDPQGQNIVLDGNLKTDNEGEYSFYTANGRYDVKTYVNGRLDGQYLDQLVFDPDALTLSGDLLTPVPGWDDVPRLDDYSNLNAQAQALVNRLNFLDSGIGSTRVGFAQVGASNSSRSIQDKLRDVLSVKDFGASGDGVTDDTAAIQAAAVRAGMIGATLVFPDGGTYCISSPIVLQITDTLPPAVPGMLQWGAVRTVNVRGDGLAVIKATAAMPQMFRYTFDVAEDDIAPFFSDVVGVTLDGNNLAVDGIYIEWALGLTVSQCRFMNLINGVHNFGYGVMRLLYNAMRTQVGVWVERGGDNLIQHNDFYPSAESGICVKLGYYSGNTTLHRNTCNNDALATVYGVVLDGSASISGDEEIRHVTINDNEFQAMTTAVRAIPHSNAAKRNMWQCTISNNHLLPSAAAFTGTLADLTRCDNFIIKNNFVGALQKTDATGYALKLDDCRDLVLSDNQFARYTGSAILMNNCTDALVVDNKFMEIGKGSASTPCVSVTGASSAANTFRHNKFRQVSASYGQIGISESGGAAGTDAQDNTFRNIATPYQIANTDWAVGSRVLVNDSFSRSYGTGFTPRIQVTNGGYGTSRWLSDGSGNVFELAKSRSGTAGVQGIVQNGDELGLIAASGSDSAALIRAAGIRFAVDGAPGLNDMPGRIEFLVTPDGGASWVEAMRLRNDGALVHRNNATVIVNTNSLHILRSYTVAGLPSAGGANDSALVRVTDGTGSKRLAISDGTNWRWPDGAIVS